MRKITTIGVLSLALIAFGAAAYAGPHCSSSKQASAGASCAYKAKTASLDMDIETSRLPSGALLVFYTSDKPEVVKAMHARAAKGASEFDCGVCQQVAASNNCTVELAPFAGGVIAFITSEDAGAVDAYEKQFAALNAPAPVN